MKSRIFILAFWLLACINSYAGTIDKTLYLNADSLLTVNGMALPYLAYNETAVYDTVNARIMLQTGDSLRLKVINNDTITHGFEVMGLSGSSLTILPSDSGTVTLHFPDPGLFIYRDGHDAPKNHYLGAAGMILVESSNSHPHFYWNIKEHFSDWNFDLTTGIPVDWSNYKPDFFTINGKSKPYLQNDTTAAIKGSVGDTILIMVANTGRSIHSLHFHGYHCGIRYSSKHASHAGRSKDTFPIYPMETLILEMIPDKPGLYPVHDHNLTALTGASYYPNGIFIMMDIL